MEESSPSETKEKSSKLQPKIENDGGTPGPGSALTGDPLLGNDRETNETTAVARQQLRNTQQYWSRC
jgi:hypothetical protein